MLATKHSTSSMGESKPTTFVAQWNILMFNLVVLSKRSHLRGGIQQPCAFTVDNKAHTLFGIIHALRAHENARISATYSYPRAFSPTFEGHRRKQAHPLYE